MNAKYKQGLAFGLSLSMLFGGVAVIAPTEAVAQKAKKQSGKQQVGVGQLVQGLANVNVGAINVQAYDVVDVKNVLNNNQIRVLNKSLNKNKVASDNSQILTNTLRDADIIKDNQVVVGLLSKQKTIYTLTR